MQGEVSGNAALHPLTAEYLALHHRDKLHVAPHLASSPVQLSDRALRALYDPAGVRADLPRYHRLPDDLVQRMMLEGNEGERLALAASRWLEPEQYRRMLEVGDMVLLVGLLVNPSAGFLFEGGRRERTERKLLESGLHLGGWQSARHDLASSPLTTEATLRELAGDRYLMCAVALNPGTSEQLVFELLGDRYGADHLRRSTEVSRVQDQITDLAARALVQSGHLTAVSLAAASPRVKPETLLLMAHAFPTSEALVHQFNQRALEPEMTVQIAQALQGAGRTVFLYEIEDEACLRQLATEAPYEIRLALARQLADHPRLGKPAWLADLLAQDPSPAVRRMAGQANRLRTALGRDL